MTCHKRNSGTAASWRAGLGALALLLAVPAGAAAADMPVLRGSFLDGGSRGYVRWDGLQMGAQFGWSNLTTDFGDSTSSSVAYMLRNTVIENEFSPSSWAALPKDVSNSSSWGAFIGYNVQWGQLVVGADIGYTRMTSMDTAAADSESRQFTTTSDGFANAVTVTGQAAVKLIDYATIRGRAGYAFGQFLPYAVLGAAVGRFNYAVTASVDASGTPPSGSGLSPYHITPSQTDSGNNVYVAGLDVGLGLDVAVTPNLFLRGEWEYIAFGNFHGIHNAMNTGRVGVGVRF